MKNLWHIKIKWLSQDLMVRENTFEQMFSDSKSVTQCSGKSMDFAVWEFSSVVFNHYLHCQISQFHRASVSL